MLLARCKSYLGGVGDRGWVDVGRDANVVKVGLGQQGLEEGIGVAQPILLDQGGVSGKPISPVKTWDSELASTFYEEQGICCTWDCMYSVHGCQIQGPKLQEV